MKVTSNLQLTADNGNNNEITVKESSFHHGVAVPMSLEDLEKEIAREKDIINKAKKKMAMESSTLKDGISTWILLSGSNNPTTRPEIKPATYRIENVDKKPAKVNISSNAPTTKKRNPVTTTMKITKPTQKYNSNKLLTRIKVSPSNELKNTTEIESATTATTKKPQLTTKAKKYTTQRAKTTTISTTPSTTTITSTETIEDEPEEKSSVSPPVDSAAFLILEPKDADFDLPHDRAPAKSTPSKKTTKPSTTKSKKKKIVVPTNSTSTKIKKKSDKKPSNTKIAKKPEKPITTQIYNYLAREVMPTVGVGLVGLMVTAGLATYFLGGPLGALRRSYDIASRRDDEVPFDRSDDFGNVQNEEDMFGKVIAGMPENSAYRNNIRVQSAYHPQQYSGGYSKYSQQSPKYGVQPQSRYRTAEPYQGYQNQYAQYYQQQQQQAMRQQQLQQAQAKSAMVDYPSVQQNIQAQPVSAQNVQAYNMDAVEITTYPPESYSLDYEDIAQSYFPQKDEEENAQVSIEPQKMLEIEQKKVQPQYGAQQSEKITIVQAQSVPTNHKTNEKSYELPTPAALVSHSDEEYQNSIANAIMNQKKQFVVGTVVAENFEDNSASAVPEHGPRKRRNVLPIKIAPKSLDDNEIDDDLDGKIKLQSETSTTAHDETVTHEVHESTTHLEKDETLNENESTTTTYVYDINGQTNLFGFMRRVIELKLRLGLNFLQNATLAFQHYLKGVEERVQTSPLFNPFLKNNSTNETTSRKINKNNHKKVEPVEVL